jgi:hypothetical protein
MLAPDSKRDLLNRAAANAPGLNDNQPQASASVGRSVATPTSRTGVAQVKETSRPRELFEGFITTLRHSDVLIRKNASGNPETFRERVLKNQKLEKPLCEFLEQERRTASAHKEAITIILDRASKLEKRTPNIPRDHPKRYVWEETNSKLKSAKTVTALLELLKEPAAERNPVMEALKAWAKPPSVVERLKGLFSPSPKLLVYRFASSLLEDLTIN